MDQREPHIPQAPRGVTVTRTRWGAPSVGWSLWHERHGDRTGQTWWLRTPLGWEGPHRRARALELLDAAAHTQPEAPSSPRASVGIAAPPSPPEFAPPVEVKPPPPVEVRTRQLALPCTQVRLSSAGELTNTTPATGRARTYNQRAAKVARRQLALDLRQLGLPGVR